MKVILEFEFPEQKDEYDWHFHGPAAFATLCTNMDFLRKKRKYANENTVEIVMLENLILHELSSRGIENQVP
jgi:hypothetical protein